jgi:hypothetical protein
LFFIILRLFFLLFFAHYVSNVNINISYRILIKYSSWHLIIIFSCNLCFVKWLNARYVEHQLSAYKNHQPLDRCLIQYKKNATPAPEVHIIMSRFSGFFGSRTFLVNLYRIHLPKKNVWFVHLMNLKFILICYIDLK